MSMNKLVTASVIGAGACCGMVYLFNRKLSETIKNSTHYEEAINIVKNNEAAKKFLGEPIQDLQPELILHSKTFKGISEAKVVVFGPKSKGTVFITLLGESTRDLKLDTIQLQVGLDQSKRLVIKESQREISSAN